MTQADFTFMLELESLKVAFVTLIFHSLQANLNEMCYLFYFLSTDGKTNQTETDSDRLPMSHSELFDSL